MAKFSNVQDDVLCQVANEAETAYSESQKQSDVCKQQTDQPLPVKDRLLSGNPSKADLFDINEDIMRTYRDEIGCDDGRCMSASPSKAAVGDKNADVISDGLDEITCDNECIGESGCLTSNMDINRSKASVCDDLVHCNGDILVRHATQNLTGGGGNHTVSDSYVEESQHSSNSGCLSNASDAGEPDVDLRLANGLENAPEARKLDDEEDIGELCDGKLTSKCSTDSGEPQACDDKGLDSSPAKNLAEECPSKPVEPPAFDKKLPCLSFSSDVLLVAPTGKAANVLGRRTGLKAFTLHQVIFSYRYWSRSEFKSLVAWKFDSVRVLVVDESSLVAVTTFYSLISKVLPSLQKVVLLGDILQLPSIEPGTPLLLIPLPVCVYLVYLLQIMPGP